MKNKGTEQTFLAAGECFAAEGLGILMGLKFRRTAAGWQLIVSRVTNDRKKQVLFIDDWDIEGLLESFYKVVRDGYLQECWRDDKF